MLADAHNLSDDYSDVATMINQLLFLTTCLIWGSTWIAIHYQIGVVEPLWSITYRFAVAGLLMLVASVAAGRTILFSRRDHLLIAIQGILIFSLNFIFVYHSSAYLVSGLVAVAFASILIMNMIHSRLFFKMPLSVPFVVGALLGLTGLATIFSDDVLTHLQSSSVYTQVLGIGLCLLGAYSASLGNMLVVNINKRHLPLLATTGYSMLYSAAFTAAVALLMHKPISFDFSSSYVWSLVYLVFAGSFIGFISYMTLIRRVGPTHAAYVFVFTPIIAMIISTFLEHFTWGINTYIGLALVITGQVLVLYQREK
jgi:drug/metabolite transporter (DMT)-like permease